MIFVFSAPWIYFESNCNNLWCNKTTYPWNSLVAVSWRLNLDFSSTAQQVLHPALALTHNCHSHYFQLGSNFVFVSGPSVHICLILVFYLHLVPEIRVCVERRRDYLCHRILHPPKP